MFLYLIKKFWGTQGFYTIPSGVLFMKKNLLSWHFIGKCS